MHYAVTAVYTGSGNAVAEQWQCSGSAVAMQLQR